MPTSDADLGGVPYRLDTIEDHEPFAPKDGFIEGEHYVLYMNDPFQLNQAVLGYTIYCVAYDSSIGARSWITVTQEVYRDGLLNGITRDESLDGVGHEAYILNGLFNSPSAGTVFKSTVIWMRVLNVACYYHALDENVEPSAQTEAMVRSVAARALKLAGE